MTIYCDHNASTPLRNEAFEAMLPYLREQYGNPSSVHRLGSAARCAVEEARAEVAALIGARPNEIVFTSGGTEADNLAILGAARAVAATSGPSVLVTTAIEHAAVREPVSVLVRAGWQARELPLSADGRVPIEAIGRFDWDGARLASVAWANNEVGGIQPIEELSKVCRDRGILLHSDAVQAVGKIPVFADLVDLLSISAHKLGGPKGVGALYVRSGIEIEALTFGGGQERERRAGTENVAGIVGLGAACRAAAAELSEYARQCRQWCEGLWQALSTSITGLSRNSAPGEGCLPNTLHVSFEGVRGEALVAALDLAGIAVSSGSACAAGAGEPSHVLLALGRDADAARNGLRLSCGRSSTIEEIPQVVAATRAAVDRIRRG